MIAFNHGGVDFTKLDFTDSSQMGDHVIKPKTAFKLGIKMVTQRLFGVAVISLGFRR